MRSNPHSHAAPRVKASDRLLLSAQNSVVDDVDDSIMASAAPERQVQVTACADANVAHDIPPNDLTTLMQVEIQRLQTELKRAHDANREISDKNR